MRLRLSCIFFLQTAAASTACADEVAILQVAHTNSNFSSDFSSLSSSLKECATGFACGALGAKVSKDDLVQQIGFTACTELLQKASVKHALSKLQPEQAALKKALPCAKKKLKTLQAEAEAKAKTCIKTCEFQKKDAMAQKTHSFQFSQQEKENFKKECNTKCDSIFEALQHTVNVTIWNSLYKECGYPQLASKSKSAQQAVTSAKGSPPSQLCGLIGLGLTNKFLSAQAKKESGVAEEAEKKKLTGDADHEGGDDGGDDGGEGDGGEGEGGGDSGGEGDGGDGGGSEGSGDGGGEGDGGEGGGDFDPSGNTGGDGGSGDGQFDPDTGADGGGEGDGGEGGDGFDPTGGDGGSGDGSEGDDGGDGGDIVEDV